MPRKCKGGNLFQMRKCAMCGKELVRLNFNEYAYKDGTKYFCGWTCMRTAERIAPVKRKYIRSQGDDL